MAKKKKTTTALRLTLDECEPGALPPVCAKCGAETSGETRVKFRLYPSWLVVVMILAPMWYLILALVLRKTRVAYMPVCPRHEGTWNWGRMIVALTLGLTLPTLLSLRSSSSSQPVLFFAVMGVGLLVGLVVSRCGIQPKEMTRGDMLLDDLHPEFVHAVKEDRVGGDAGRAPRASGDYVTLTRA